MKTHPLPQLFIDQDGVLADLDAHFALHFGKKAEHPCAFSPEEFWGSVNSVPNFWETIPPIDGAVAFWGALMRLHGRPVILTSLSQAEWTDPADVERQKRAWAASWLPGAELIVCRGKDKRLHCTRQGDILVDDWEKHRDPWEQRGGVFIQHYTDLRNTLRLVEYQVTKAKMLADQRTMFKAFDGTMMCELHPGEEWGRCRGGKDCVGPGMPWVLTGKTAILAALKP